LHIDQQVGSIKPGKDADLVLWNGPPLSDASHPIKTFVDGVCYFDYNADMQRQLQNDQERLRLLKAMTTARNNGENSVKPSMQQLILQHCNDNEKLPK
jgi:urease alpha subunit